MLDCFKLYRIRSKLLAVFVTAALIFSGGGVVTIVFFNDILATTQGFVDDTLPKINAAKHLDITARDIDVNIHRLMNGRDRRELNLYFATTSDLLEQLERLTAAMSQEDGHTNILSLNRASQAIRTQAQLVFQVSTQRLLLQTQVETLSRRARQGLQEMAVQHAADASGAEAAPPEVRHRTVLAMLNSAERGLVAGSEAAVEEQHQRYRRHMAQFQEVAGHFHFSHVAEPSTSDDPFAELERFAGLFALRSQQIRLDAAIAVFLNQLNQEMTQLSAVASDHSRRVFNHFQLRADALLTRQRQVIGLTLGLILMASLALFIVHRKLVVKGFGDRLTQISAAMERVPSKSSHTLVPVAGTDEIASMARALEGFLAQALRLRQLATEDELTGVDNRRRFLERAALVAEQSKRDAKPACLLMLDIDRFKVVNDTHGHDTGDRALKACAQTCLGSIRPLDLFARYGGEEFVLLLPDTDCAPGMAAGERIRKAVEALRIPLGGGEQLRFTLSIGMVQVDLSRVTIEEALKRADQALYRAKSDGRNRLVCWNPDAENAA
ncbi:GGDEF domain-containing protein [Sedimenticola hydrogenitrophicus]|uniref:GGDEF domain-containing protein n=1 Tax=Sedimenticola hydrogenitrophicus TaxID=2967975 RepID=UPI0023B0CAE4|nr:GGDEF domain-containing protein [Sedimenticola hydrogenitrophicus]